MAIERIKQIFSKKKYIIILLSILLLLILAIYFKTFFTTGAYFEDTFLKKEVISFDNHYIGKSVYGDIHITVKGIENKHKSADVIYRLPNSINKQYTVNFKDASNWGLGIENIEDENGKIIFDGEYKKGDRFLFDKSGKPLLEGSIRFRMDGVNPYKNGYKISLLNIVKFASFEKDGIRGDAELLMLAILLLVLVTIDIRFPLFFFTLSHFLDVKDPEPSDFYIMMQRISWVAYPLIAMVLMIASIT